MASSRGPPARTAARGSTPCLRLAEERISPALISVHSLQRMPPEAAPNPQFAVDFGVHLGRTLAVGHIVATWGAIQSVTDAPRTGATQQHAPPGSASSSMTPVDVANPGVNGQRVPGSAHTPVFVASESIRCVTDAPRAGTTLQHAPPGPALSSMGPVDLKNSGVNGQRVPGSTHAPVVVPSGAIRSVIDAPRTGATQQPAPPGPASSLMAHVDLANPGVNGQRVPGSAHVPVEMNAEKPFSAEDNVRNHQLKVDDALAYLEMVRCAFSDAPNMYNQFLDIMKAFKAKSIDTAEVISRVTHLFQGNAELILGFNRFLPFDYKIHIMIDNVTGNSITGYNGPNGFSQVSAAPKNHCLTRLVPHHSLQQNAGGPSTVSAVTAIGADSILPRQDDRPLPQNAGGPSTVSGADAVGADSILPRQDDPPLQQSPAVDFERVVERAGPSQPPEHSPGQQDGAAFSAQDAEGDVSVVDADLSALKKDLHGSLKASDEQYRNGLSNASSLLVKLRSRPNGERLFERFQEIVENARQTEGKKADELCQAVNELLVDHSDLLEQFKQMLSPFYNSSASNGGSSLETTIEAPNKRNHPRVQLERGENSQAAAFARIREAIGTGRSHLYTEFLKCLQMFTVGIVTRAELQTMISELFTSLPRALELFDNSFGNIGIPDLKSDGEQMKSESGCFEEEDVEVDVATIKNWKVKSMSEVAEGSREIVGMSYRSLPRGYPQPMCSGQSPLERATLNDRWVAVTQNSAEYTAKFMRQNVYEEKMYQCEDDRYELDMMVEANTSTIMALQSVAAAIVNAKIDEQSKSRVVDDALTSIQYNAIQRIYGNKDAVVLKHLRHRPECAIPVVLARLKEKDAFYRRYRTNMNRMMRDTSGKNYYRSLDHRSGIHCAAEKKQLSSKTLIADVVDPVASAAARDQEYGRSRGYVLGTSTTTGGLGNDWSRTVDAVAKCASAGAPYTLSFVYEDDMLHRSAYNLITIHVLKDVHDAEAARTVLSSFRELISTFYGVTLDEEDPICVTDEGKHLLYANESIYCMVRLYDLLYERLALAKKMAQAIAADQRHRNEMNAKGHARFKDDTHLPKTKTHSRDLLQSFNSNYFSVKPSSVDADHIFTQFLTNLKAFLTTRAFTTEQYEDSCRELLGPKSFLVFTLGKVIAKTAANVVKVCSPSNASRPLIDLYHRALRMRSCEDPSKESGAEEKATTDQWLYMSAARAQLRHEKGAGAILFHMCYSENTLALSVATRTPAEDDENACREDEEHLHSFLQL